ncbi:MAG: hypothetical protein WCF33_25370, partial [Pseudonocardiaceae bacterium]
MTARPRPPARRHPILPRRNIGWLRNLSQPGSTLDRGPTMVVALLPLSPQLLPDTPGCRSRVRARPGSATTPLASVVPR